MAKLINFRPKKIFKLLNEEYKKRIEDRYGEHILRHVIQTQNFAYPSEDYTGQINDVVAKKTRQMLNAHQELVGPNQMPVEEIKIEEEQQ